MKPNFPDLSLPPLLLVDDCEDDIFLLRHRLRDGGITNPITSFDSAVQVLRWLESAHDAPPPGLLFTDIKMPDGEGFGLIREIRAHSHWDDLRLVVMTASNDPADLERALDAGANGYLLKFPPAELLAEFVQHGPWFAMPRKLHSKVPANVVLTA